MPVQSMKLRKEIVKALNDEVLSDKIELQHLLLYLIVFHRDCKLDYKFEFLFRMIDADKDDHVTKIDFIEFFKPLVDKSKYKATEAMIHRLFEVCEKDDKQPLHIDELRNILNEDLKVMVYRLMTTSFE